MSASSSGLLCADVPAALVSDSNCVKMLDLGVVPHILTMLEQHVDEGDVSVQHAGLSALRNLAIPGTGPVKAAPQHRPSNLLAFMSKVFVMRLI